MIWADRVAIVWGLLLSPIVILNENPQHAAYYALWFTAIPWLVMRGIDFIASGQIRRA